jgi:hypothetical protein
MRNKMLVGAICAAALAFPAVANAQDGAGPTNWANAGGTDPARDLVGLGVRIFDRGQAYGPGLPAYPYPNYSSLARYDSRVSAGTSPKKK